jgi:cold shock CspA family protein
MFTGTVATWFSGKSYGFIKSDSDRTSRFFHLASVVDDYHPRVGDRVQFELEAPCRLGMPDQAVNVQPTESTTPKVGA